MDNFDIRKWRRTNFLNESSGQNKRMTEEEKKQTLEAVSKFNELGQNIYKTTEISELVENIKRLAENASKMAIEETADWFDAVSVKRDTKAIGESVKIFESTFREISTLQQRLESVFEDIGGKLGKYYEIKEIEDVEEAGGTTYGEDEKSVEEAELSAAQEKYQKLFKSLLAKFGVDSPDELDDEKKKKFFNLVDKSHKGKNETVNRFKEQVNEAFEGLTNVVSAPGYAINLKTEAAPKMKSSKEQKEIGNIMKMVANAKKGGGSGRYGKEFESAKKKALKAIKDMLTYSKIGV